MVQRGRGLEGTCTLCYAEAMPKNAPKSTITTVRDSKSGRLITIKGVGALKGKLTISKKVDLTKPISGPAAGTKWTPNGLFFSGKVVQESDSANNSIAKR